MLATPHQARPHPAVRFVLLAVVLALAAVACGGHRPAATGATTTAPATDEVSTAYVAQVHATVLVDGAGFALYLFAPDHRSAVTCNDVCAATWPPAYAPIGAKVRAAQAAQASLVGSDPDRSNGRRVVTYDGWPLYTYVADLQPGFATGQAVDLDGGYWYLIEPDGTPVVPPGSPAPVPGGAG